MGELRLPFFVDSINDKSKYVMRQDSAEAVATTWSLTTGGVLLAQLHAILGVVVLVSSLAYTIWRWHRDVKTGK